MAILTVGATGEYKTLSSAVAASQNGDTIEVAAGTYTNDFSIINTDITIEGVGGMVNLVATESPTNHKAILTTNSNVTLDNISFSGAAVSGAYGANGAGIRYQAGNLTINDCYFHNNQEGLLAGDNPAGSITINDSEFAYNGTGSGLTHNLYVGQVGTLTVTNSYFHDANVGHEIKSRALNTIIENNRIQDGNGSSSYSIDLPTVGNVVISGNTIEQGAHSDNPAIIHIGGSGVTYPGSSVLITGNTIVNYLNAGDARAVLNQSPVTATFTGNTTYGLTAAQIATGPVSASGTVALTNAPTLDTAHPFPGTTVPPDVLVLYLSQDAGVGGIQFTATAGGHALGGVQSIGATAPSQAQTFSFTGSFGAGPLPVTIDFAKDGLGVPGSDPRQLHVVGIDYDGTHYGGDTAALLLGGSTTFSVGQAQSAQPAHPVVHSSPV